MPPRNGDVRHISRLRRKNRLRFTRLSREEAKGLYAFTVSPRRNTASAAPPADDAPRLQLDSAAAHLLSAVAVPGTVCGECEAGNHVL